MENIIAKLNNDINRKPVSMDNSRYGVIVDDIASNTAYFFSSPIYCIGEKRLAPMNFEELSTQSFILKGTNSTTKVDSSGFYFEKATGEVWVEMDLKGLQKCFGEQLLTDHCRILPTTNGVVVSCKATKEKPVTLRVKSSLSDAKIVNNSKSFSIMEERHTPLFSLSTLYAVNAKKRKLPVLLKKRVENDSITLIIDSPELANADVYFEMNMYEHKLIQDTTVEKRRPQENNAFGSSAFLGSSNTFGEQWLYMKLDYSFLSGLQSMIIESAKIYIPNYQGQLLDIEAFSMDVRFCSFGSNWDNKALQGRRSLDVCVLDDYYCVDLTGIMTDKFGRLKFSNGFLLKARGTQGQYCILATGDSCFNPPIVEIKYKK